MKIFGTFYVLVPTAVCDHGVIGIYSTEQEAIDAAAEIWPVTDGHHAFMIYPREIGVSQFHVFAHKMHEDDAFEGAGEQRVKQRDKHGFRVFREHDNERIPT